jgi:hypothetical protein
MPNVAIGMESTDIACQTAQSRLTTPATRMITYEATGDVPIFAVVAVYPSV